MSMLKGRCVAWCLGLASAVGLGSCAEPTASPSAARSRYASAPVERPGLATRWGETRTSRVTATSFRRANASRPLATAAIYYNDASGIRAMAAASSPRRTPPQVRGDAGSLLTIEVRDGNNRLLPGLAVGERWFVVGEHGQRYVIVLHNRSEFRLEGVLSVDGLDVLDGRPASPRKRGYIIPPQGTIRVDGFRQSTEAVAAFRFGSVSESYANQKYGDTRNVGVIGIAIFHEYGTTPLDEEARRRLRANPFPGRFATPP